MVGLRIARIWNQVGNKWLSFPDFGQFLNNPQNKLILNFFVYLTLGSTAVYILYYLSKQSIFLGWRVSNLTFICAKISSYSFINFIIFFLDNIPLSNNFNFCPILDWNKKSNRYKTISKYEFLFLAE